LVDPADFAIQGESNMSIESNRAVVLKFYECMSKQDFTTMFSLLADDATWTVAGKPETFWAAGVHTKAQRAHEFNDFVKTFKSLNIDVRSTTAEEDRVVIEFRTTAKTHSGLDYENEMLVLVRCKDGKIVSIYEQLDQPTALAFAQKLREANTAA
jgi:ketosteroid isomerase-like protein